MSASGEQGGGGGFRVLAGGRRVETSLHGVRIVISRREDAPFGIDAMAAEEDTWLALSTKQKTLSDAGHPVRVMTRVWDAEPEPLGTVAVMPGSPLRFLAVVHDLDAEPTCRPETVATALEAVWREALKRRLRAIGLPLLGCEHGGLAPERFMAMLADVLSRFDDPAEQRRTLRRVWVVRGPQSGAALLAALGG